MGVGDHVARGEWTDRAQLGAAYLAGSASAYGSGLEGLADAAGFAARVAGADAFVHQQDHAETDLLESPEYAAHEGGLLGITRNNGLRKQFRAGDSFDRKINESNARKP